MRMKFLFLAAALIVTFLSASSAAFAHEERGAQVGLSEFLKTSAVNYIWIASAFIGLITIAAIIARRKSERMKWFFFLSIAIPVVIVTAYSAGGTVYLNLVSYTGGPVHWHADFEIWNCGESVDVMDPTGILNRIGSPTMHEHGDFRIHIEGDLVERSDASLHSFFNAIGGFLGDDVMIVPTNEGPLELTNGETCNGGEGILQVFVYKVTNPDDLKKWNFVQEKVDDFPEYVLSPYSLVPPGDCIIIEFDQEKEKTDRVCETYRIAIDKGELRGG